MFAKFFKLCLILSFFFPCFAHTQSDDLFTIDKSEVEAPLTDSDTAQDIDALNQATSQNRNSSQSKALLRLLDTPSAYRPTKTLRVSTRSLDAELATLSSKSTEGWNKVLPHRLISKWHQSYVGSIIAPTWLEQHAPSTDPKALRAKPFIQHKKGELEYRGFNQDNYFVADKVIDDVIFARYYFKIVKTDRSYFEPAGDFDTNTNTVTMWKMVKFNVDAERMKAEKDRAREAKRRAERETKNVTPSKPFSQSSSKPSYTRIRPPIVKFNTPKKGEVCGKCGGSGKLTTHTRASESCELVADNDAVFIRSKRVCTKTPASSQTRWCHKCDGTGRVY